MESVFERNLNSLKSRDFEIYNYYLLKGNSLRNEHVVVDEIGNVIYKGRRLYKRDIEKTAYLRVRDLKDIPRNKVKIILGFGNGSEAKILLREYGQKNLLFVVNPEIFFEILKKQDLTDVLSSDGIIDIYDDSPYSLETLSVILEDQILLDEVEIVNLNIPGEDHIAKDLIVRFKAVKQNVATRLVHVKKFISNLSENFIDVYRLPGVKNLYGIFEELPVLVVSGGPSLDRDIEKIKLVKDKMIIVAISASLKPLVNAGIEPDLVVYVDPTKLQYEKYFSNAVVPEKTFTVFSEGLHPDFFKKCNRGFVYHLSFEAPNAEMIFRRFTGEDKGYLIGGGSVAHVAFHLASLISSGPIVIVAQDMAYPLKGKTHASGSGSDEEIEILPGDENYIWVEGINGELVPTKQDLMIFKEYFESFVLPLHGRPLINATSYGLPIKGFKHVDLLSEYVMELLPEKEIEKFDRLRAVYRENLKEISEETIKMWRNHAEESLNILDEICSEISTLNSGINDVVNALSAVMNLLRDSTREMIFKAALEVSNVDKKMFALLGNLRRRRENIRTLGAELMNIVQKAVEGLSFLKERLENVRKKLENF